MKNFGQQHLMLLFATIIFVALTMYLAYKLPRKWQNVLFVLGAVMCAGGLFWRYALNMTLSPFELHLDTLLIQLLQVCNFNFVLVILMLIPRLELARQYSFMFSMFAAATVMVSIPSRYASAEWYSPDFLNFWLNHVFAIALPLWMFAAGRLKPQKKYILPVAGCVIAYFLIVYGGTEWLRSVGKIAENKSFSYVHDAGGLGFLEWMYELIPMPCFYLAPLIPPMLGFFWLLCRMIEKFKAPPESLLYEKAAKRSEALNDIPADCQTPSGAEEREGELEEDNPSAPDSGAPFAEGSLGETDTPEQEEIAPVTENSSDLI